MKNLLEREEIKLAFSGKSNTGIEVSCFSLDDDFSLDGFDARIINVMWPDCRVRVSVGNGNLINIVGFPKWVAQALWLSRLQGKEESIEVLGKLINKDIDQVAKQSVYVGPCVAALPDNCP